MQLNLTELIALQAQLDERIMALHQEERHNTRIKRVLALIVEINELANETRCFKYWSLKGSSHKDVLLEEFSDTMHFVISLGIDLGFDTMIFHSNEDAVNLTQLFIDWINASTALVDHFDLEHFNKVGVLMATMAKALNFDEKACIETYYAKNKTNHIRQSEAY